MNKHIAFYLLLSFFVPLGLQAQTQEVVKGTRADAVFVYGADNGVVTALSKNGRYAVGTYSNKGGSGFLYDIEKDTVEFIPLYPWAVSNNKIAAGQGALKIKHPATGKDFLVDAGAIVRDGKTIFMPQYPGSEYLNDVSARYASVYGISEDGTRVAGSIYYIYKQQIQFAPVLFLGDTISKIYSPLDKDGESSWMNGARPGPGGISPDGQVLFGFSVWPKMAQRSPVCWVEDTIIHLGLQTAKEQNGWGEVYGSNKNGHILCGFTGNFVATIWEKGKEVHQVPTPAGYIRSEFWETNEQGMFVGNMISATGIEKAALWSESMGWMLLEDYLMEYYGLDVLGRNLVNISGISEDGRVLAGFSSSPAGNYLPFVIKLGESPILVRPQKMVAKQMNGEKKVKCTWKKPFFSGKTVLGYEVYRDSIKISNTLITETSFTDVAAIIGFHSYRVRAVYAEGTSNFTLPVVLEIIAPEGCYSVKYTQASALYNRTAILEWGIPSSISIGKAPKPIYREMPAYGWGETCRISEELERLKVEEPERLKAEEPESLFMQKADKEKNSGAKEAPVVDKYFDANMLYMVDYVGVGSPDRTTVVEYKGKFYASDWRFSQIDVFDKDWHALYSFNIDKLPPVTNFVAVGEEVYAGCDDQYIYQLDLENKSIKRMIPVPEKINHIAYIPKANDGKGGFELGAWTSSIIVDMDGNKISDGFENIQYASGSVYYKDHVYFMFQDRNGMDIHQYDWNTKKATGKNVDLYREMRLLNSLPYGGIGAGLNLFVLEDSTICIGAVLQTRGSENIMAYLEIESMPKLKGYNIYRSGESTPINKEPNPARRFYETILEPGIYNYQVSSVFENGCESNRSDSMKIEINPIGVVHPVTKLHVRESNLNAMLKWGYPQEGSDGFLLGFYIYRDGSLITEKMVDKFMYIDEKPGLGLHRYRVEAFYDNSGVASDSIELEITGLGTCLPVSYLNLTSSTVDKGKGNVSANWGLPFFETPFTAGYAEDYPIGKMGMKGGTLTACIGWDKAGLQSYKGYFLVGIQTILAEECDAITPVVMINDTIVYHQPYNKRLVTNEPFIIYLDKPLSIDSAINSNMGELVVGLTYKFKEGKLPAVVDRSAAVTGFGDLFTIDFKKWGTLQTTSLIPHNWDILAIVATERQIGEGIQNIPPKDLIQVKIKAQSGSSLRKIEPHTACKTSIEMFSYPFVQNVSAPKIVLNGFNIYRDAIKLNQDTLTDLNYLDKGLMEGEYVYRIGSLYNTGEEILSEEKTGKIVKTNIESDLDKIKVKIYPNPTRDYLFIEGEYSNFEFCDLVGRIMFSEHRASTFGHTQSLQLSSYPKGVYILKFKDDLGRESTRKVVLQ